MTIHEAGAVGEPRFEIAAVLIHVCKIWPSAGQDGFVVEACGAPNVTHAMVSALESFQTLQK